MTALRVALRELKADYDRARKELAVALRDRFISDDLSEDGSCPEAEDLRSILADFDWAIGRACAKAKEALR